MNLKNIFLLFFLALCQFGSANNPTEFIPVSGTPIGEDFSCNLPGPSSVHIDVVGSDFVTASWPLVSGAAQYEVQAFDAISGDGLGTPIFVPGNVLIATVTTVGNTSGVCYVKVTTYCETGERGGSQKSGNFDTIIIDLVSNGYTHPQGATPECTLPVGVLNSCDFSWDANETTFQVSYTSPTYQYYVRAFSLNVTIGQGDIQDIVNVNIDNTGNDGQYLCFEIEYESGNPARLLVKFRSDLTKKPTELIATLTAAKLAASSPGKFFKFTPGNPSCIVRKLIPGPGGRPGGPTKLPGINTTKFQSVAKPNPFQDALTVQLPESSFKAETTVSLYNLLGALQQHQIVPAGQNELTLNTADLSPGVYLLKTESEGNIETIKVVKTQ